jgi:hypothetical protein
MGKGVLEADGELLGPPRDDLAATKRRTFEFQVNKTAGLRKWRYLLGLSQTIS